MAQKFLDDAHIGAAVEKMRCERMPQRVRADALRQARYFRDVEQNQMRALACQRAASGVHEKFRVRRRLHWPGTDQIRTQRFPRVLTKRNGAGLIAFASQPDGGLIQVHIVYVDANGLADTRSRPVQELQECEVAVPMEPGPDSRGLKEPADIVDIDSFGKPQRNLGRRDLRHRVGLAGAF